MNTSERGKSFQKPMGFWIPVIATIDAYILSLRTISTQLPRSTSMNRGELWIGAESGYASTQTGEALAVLVGLFAPRQAVWRQLVVSLRF
jgi:hypothetical protein